MVAGGLVVALLLAELVVMLVSFRSVRHHTRIEQRDDLAVLRAGRIEKLVLDLETGTRGYVITRDRRFLEPWRSAQQALPHEQVLLAQVAPTAFAARVGSAWQSYLAASSRPLVALVDRGASQAELRAASRDGKRRVDAIRGLIDPFVAQSERRGEDERSHVVHTQHLGFVLGLGGFGAAIVLFLAFLAYFIRAAIAPVRRITDATERMALGDRDVEVAEAGAGEVGRLAAAFNTMSRSLTKQRTELAEQNVDLERLANLLRAVLDSTVDGIVLTDAEGEVQLANRPMLRITEELGMEYTGTAVDRLLSVAPRVVDEDRYRAAMERLRSDPDEPTFDEFEDALTGRVFQGFTSPVLDDGRRMLGRVWTLRDVTQERELDRLKDDFVATVSHELRTPLTSMMGFLEMLREGEAGPLTDEQKRFLAIVYRSSERLQRLVGDLLFVARLDASGLQLQFAPVAVDDIVRDCVESASALARSRELELRAELDSVPPVHADRERLGQLVSNLVSNAIKFTPAGGEVVVRTFTRDSYAVIEVEDTGVGIPEQEQERLFQRFFRSSTASEHAIPGTGLGLVISKAIAEAHGGGIVVRSAPGEGTCFRVRLPLDPGEEVAA
jgi:signal transduction histidine kinase/HAMP domain-containing protein